jgi:hypothetical protein
VVWRFTPCPPNLNDLDKSVIENCRNCITTCATVTFDY